MRKVTVISHAIQGLIKYHGPKDPVQRIPFHDSISVCVKELFTRTTAEPIEEDLEDEVLINGISPKGREKERVELILDTLRETTGLKYGFRISSQNSVVKAKGSGFSASGFSALGLAVARALDAKLDSISLQEIVRLGSGSATRSLAGGFAIWYADKNGRSYVKC